MFGNYKENQSKFLGTHNGERRFGEFNTCEAYWGTEGGKES